MANDTKQLSKDLVLELKEILERLNGKTYSYDEVARVGRGLVGIYSELADNPLGIGHKKKGNSDGKQASQD